MMTRPASQIACSVATLIALAAAVRAEPPKRIADKAKEFKQAVAKLDAATIKLRKTATKSNWKAITAAVEKVHSDYQAVEKMFE